MPKILVIEDDAELRASLAGILEAYRFQVVSAQSGVDGIEKARAEQPDLVLCDVVMEGMDGYTVLRTFRRESKMANVPFIFLTGKTELEDLRHGMNLGADDYLFKPVTPAVLLASIQARLKREEVRRQFQKEHSRGFHPDFSSPEPLQKLGLTPREAEVLLWLAQGKSNAEIGIILQMQEATVKKHLEHVFRKLSVESRSAALMRALEVLVQGGDKPGS